MGILQATREKETKADFWGVRNFFIEPGCFKPCILGGPDHGSRAFPGADEEKKQKESK